MPGYLAPLAFHPPAIPQGKRAKLERKGAVGTEGVLGGLVDVRADQVRRAQKRKAVTAQKAGLTAIEEEKEGSHSMTARALWTAEPWTAAQAGGVRDERGHHADGLLGDPTGRVERDRLPGDGERDRHAVACFFDLEPELTAGPEGYTPRARGVGEVGLGRQVEAVAGENDGDGFDEGAARAGGLGSGHVVTPEIADLCMNDPRLNCRMIHARRKESSR